MIRLSENLVYKSICDLPSLQDNINDTLTFDNGGYLECGRDSAFIIYNGEIFTARTHTKAIRNLFLDKDLENVLIRLRMNTYEKSNINLRLKANFSFAAGHIKENIAVIELDTLFNISVDEVCSILLSYGISKVYTTPDENATLTRAAMKI